MNNPSLKPLIDKVMRITRTPSVRATIVPQVTVARTEMPSARKPVLYQPSIVFVLQGRKKGYIGDKVCIYDADNYFVSAIPMQFECETLGTKENPLISISVRIDLSVLREMVAQIDLRTKREKGIEACYATSLTPDLIDCLDRLMKLLAPASEGDQQAIIDTKMLSPYLLREIYYRVLQGPHGGALYALATRHNHLSDMNSVIDLIHERFADDLSVEDLAKSLNMSSTMFHQYFKELTATSPIQYVKTLRLHKAKLFMVHDGLNASQASTKVGYNSLSQFSREFKRMFGTSPSEEVARTRTMYGMDQEELLSAI